MKFQNKSSGSKIVLSEEIIEEIQDDSVPPLAKRIKKECDDEINAVIPLVKNRETIQGSIPKTLSKNNESWSKSVRSLSNKKGLSGLVKINKKSENKGIVIPASTSTSSNVNSGQKDQNKNDNKPKEPSTNGLSLLADYSDSDSNGD